MPHRHFSYETSSEDRLTLSKWERGSAIVYGFALLLLVVWIATPRILAVPMTATAAGDVPTKVDANVFARR